MKHTLVPASYLILQDEKNILLLRRENTGYEDGKYGLISGGVNLGETFTQTVIRKAREEAGIIIAHEDLKLVHMVHRKGANAERVDAFFVANKWQGTVENHEPHKCGDISWFPINNLPIDVVPKIKLAIECIGKGEFYAECGWE